MEQCTEVTPRCPVEATPYGYYLVLRANSALCAVFGVLCILQVIFCFLTRVGAYSTVITCGCLLQCLGYGGRLIMQNNPLGPAGMKLQIAIGGGVAAAADENMDLLETGDGIIIAGIAFQVATMLTCGVLVAEYIIKMLRYRRHTNGIVQGKEKRTSSSMPLYPPTSPFSSDASTGYRKLGGGWGNPRMRNEKEFLILDGLTMALVSAALTLLRSGFFYPYTNSGPKEERKQNGSSSEQLGDLRL
ncbi:hypothetical protein DL769_002260 [Monosporascus sp. CRB-8-3]|nr:hypothetical protein DL769_002260 [Monosporascus sp. CRB-8-3]